MPNFALFDYVSASVSDGLANVRANLGKRKAEDSVEEREGDGYSSDDDSEDSQTPSPGPPRKVQRKVLSHVAVPGIALPRSSYEGYTRRIERSFEAEALDDLAAALQQSNNSDEDKSEYTYYALDNFSIYRPDDCKSHANELVPLDRLQNRRSYHELVFDGILSAGGVQRYVEGVRFEILAVDGYGDEDVITLAGHICIQSRRAAAKDVWYKLGGPSPEYRRFHEPFVWLASFTKHFIDYLLETEDVTLNNFRRHFHDWLQSRFPHSVEFRLWHQRCGSMRDFRTSVAAYFGYLWKECYSIDDEESGLRKHRLWDQINPEQLKGIIEQPEIERNTVCTPFVHECFHRMYFSEYLAKRHITDQAVATRITERKRILGLTPVESTPISNPSMLTPMSLSEAPEDHQIAVGDVVTVQANTQGMWKSRSPAWYAYVQEVRDLGVRTVLDVIWLYEPGDTTIGSAYYPFPNELFMSDNCDCGRTGIDIDCVTGKVDVTWFVNKAAGAAGYFVRQKFRTIHEEDAYDFVALKQSDFYCPCPDQVSDFDACRRQYSIRDTVLVRVRDKELDDDVLEPAQIVNFNLDMKRVVVRRLQRRQTTDAKARPNELLLTADRFTVHPKKIIRKCHVRYFSKAEVAESLPVPYNRNGSGDFYIIMRDATNSEMNDDELDELGLPSLKQGLNFSTVVPFKKLRGLGIFCGGGNFDRGLEEGGSVDFKYAVDLAERAIYSYSANTRDPNAVNCYFGSVNDYLDGTMKGSSNRVIAKVGGVDFVSAGSPCPGFSRMQQNHLSEDSLRNASLVTSFVSFVDVYSPNYCLLENVVPMAQAMGPNKDQNVFAQVLASLVAMGYQTQQFLMDAWTSGDPQSRSRLFIAASAPGHEPLPRPEYTHGHHTNRFAGKSLGKSSNGLSFGKRRDDCTPFDYVSAAKATEDLPDIGDSQPQLCPPFPDHRVPSEQTADTRGLFASIPVRPEGMGLIQAVRQGLLSGYALNYYKTNPRLHGGPIAKSYSRMFPGSLFQTITTAQHLACRIQGRWLHWSQHRAATVMEIRRAQGYPDDEVVLGTPRQQVTIIGNSVDRSVAFTLGLSLRVAWMKSSENGSLRIRDVEVDTMTGNTTTQPASDSGTEISTENDDLADIHTPEPEGATRATAASSKMAGNRARAATFGSTESEHDSSRASMQQTRR